MNLFEPGPSTYEQDLMGLLDQLSPDEIEELQTYFAYKANSGHALSDHEVAMNDFLHQVRELNRINDDMALARRIAAGEDVGTGPPSPIRSPQNNPQPRRTSVVAPPIPVITKRPTGHDCVACQDPIHGTEISAPCGHYYDIGCITNLFQSATRDEALFPPRCCTQDIPFARAQLHLSQALVTTFQQKQVEFSTLKRVYCFSPKCSRFLGPLAEDTVASKVYVCPEQGCRRRTCGKCRQQHLGHLNHICRPDADATQVLELGRNSGWVRCPGCSHMVELMFGCFHMTCRCRTEFCYLCRALWKTCQCPQAEEQYLVEGNDVEDHREDVDIINDHGDDDDVEVMEPELWQERDLEEREEQEVGEADEEEQEEWQEREPEAQEFDGEEVQEDLDEPLIDLWGQEEFDAGEADQEVEHEAIEDNEEEESPELQDSQDWRLEREEPDSDDADEEGEPEMREEQEAQELVQWEGQDEEEPSELQELQEPQEWPWAQDEESDVDEVDVDEGELQQWGEPEEEEADEAEPAEVRELHWGYNAGEANEDVEPEMWEAQEEPEFEQWEGDDNDGDVYDSDVGYAW